MQTKRRIHNNRKSLELQIGDFLLIIFAKVHPPTMSANVPNPPSTPPWVFVQIMKRGTSQNKNFILIRPASKSHNSEKVKNIKNIERMRGRTHKLEALARKANVTSKIIIIQCTPKLASLCATQEYRRAKRVAVNKSKPSRPAILWTKAIIHSPSHWLAIHSFP